MILYKTHYHQTRCDGHPRANKRTGFVYTHILVAEKALGRYLPQNVEIHHFDENKKNYRNNNLVICQDRDYHNLLHTRQKVLSAGGDPNTDKICGKCQKVNSKKEFKTANANYDRLHGWCNSCNSIQNKLDYRKRISNI